MRERRVLARLTRGPRFHSWTRLELDELSEAYVKRTQHDELTSLGWRVSPRQRQARDRRDALGKQTTILRLRQPLMVSMSAFVRREDHRGETMAVGDIHWSTTGISPTSS